ncbi:MAG: ABC transporter ATP-binding protein [Lachnospiraceae bacterium]|jgi:ABC-type multidrug transport system ATPase subunit|nr:ABC transporter ATP-binding protein [Lachnospiraceae bacterium]
MIIVNDLTKRYNKLLANDHISLTVNSGELTVLLGPNGAGKSTLIKSICGLLRFKGSVTINGFDNHTADAKRILGYVPEMPALYPMLTVAEHLEFIAKAYRLEHWQEYADQLLTRFDLKDKVNKLGKELSKGMQQKVSVCCAVLPRPKVLIFDEPLVGLDPHGIREIKALIASLKQEGCALIVSTHMIDSVEEDWDTTCIMKSGKIAALCHRSSLGSGKTLEDTYFSIVEQEDQEVPK